MNTKTYKVVTSENRLERAFQTDSSLKGYKRLSGNARRGTYAVEYREGATFPTWRF